MAIIALIAIPIILNIISDSKDSADERSKEIYLDAVEQAIARKNLESSFNPTTCTVVENGNLSCDVGDLNVETTGQKPKVGGTITIKDGKITSNTLEFGGSNNLSEGEKPKDPVIMAATESNKTVAGNVPQGNYEPGDEYIINVDGEHEYHFYVLSTEGDKINLIMSNNICSDGTLATPENTCLVAWYSPRNNNFGPVTAFDYLYEVTKNWNNIENIQMNYEDEGQVSKSGYGEIKTEGNVTSITKTDGTVTATYENLKARLPKGTDLASAGCGYSEGSCPVWMVNGLEPKTQYYSAGIKEDIEGIYGYWWLSSEHNNEHTYARYISFTGIINKRYSNDDANGIRPVIEISKSSLS